jgi:hypothetical protein
LGRYLESLAVVVPTIESSEVLSTDSLTQHLHHYGPIGLHKQPSIALHGEGGIGHMIELAPEAYRCQIDDMHSLVHVASLGVEVEMQPVVVVDDRHVLGVGDVGEVGQLGDDVVSYLGEKGTLASVEIAAGVS